MHVVVFPSGVGINSMTISAICALATLSGSALGAASTCKLNAAGCCDFSGEWCNHPNEDGIKCVFVQPAGTCIVYGIPYHSGVRPGSIPHHSNGTVSGDTMHITLIDKHHQPVQNQTATLSLDTPQDIL